MEINVTFYNRQYTECESNSESHLEAVAVHANGLNSESVADALMTVIDCLSIKSLDVVQWLILLLDSKDTEVIRRAMVASELEGRAHEIALDAVSRLNPDEREKIAHDIVGTWIDEAMDGVQIVTERESANKDHGRP